MRDLVLIIMTVLLVSYALGHIKFHLSIPSVLKVLFIYVFFFGVLQFFKVPSFIIKFTIDLFFILILLGLATKSNLKFPGLPVFALFTSFYIFSVVINHSILYPSFTFYRIFIYPYLLFVAVYNIDLNEEKRSVFDKMIVFLFVVQIAGGIFKYIFFGILEKGLIGTISIDGGTYSTMLPLFAISFLLAFYLIIKPEKKYIYWSIGFLFIAYTGAKRGIWLYIPVIIFLAIYFYRKVVTFGYITKSLLNRMVLFTILGMGILVIGARLTPSLNPQESREGSFDANYVSSYAMEYTFNESEDDDVTFGRGANFLRAMERVIAAGFEKVFFGFGPDVSKGVATYGEGIWGEFGINGPTTGITQHIVQMGFPAVLIVLFAFYKAGRIFYRQAYIEYDPFWKAISFGGLLVTFVFFIDYLTYSSSFFSTLFPLSFTYFYVLAIVMLRNRDCRIASA